MTFELTMSVHCLGQITKHRILSINAESARAVPTKVAMEQVRNDPWRPATWPQNGKGMSPGGEMDPSLRPGVEAAWRQSARSAVKHAEELAEMGLHKEVVNRLLSPFRRIKVVVSGTDWVNFFVLRCDRGAQEEIRLLAQEMLEEFECSDPKERSLHLPYLSETEHHSAQNAPDEAMLRHWMLVSGFRCARVSYGRAGSSGMSFEEEAAKGLGLAEAKHWSALEHVAAWDGHVTPLHSGNYRGWRQLRKIMGG